MKTGDMSRSEVEEILSHIRDPELKAELVELFENELIGSRRSSKARLVSDVGRLRR
jgi:hypothetical protein